MGDDPDDGVIVIDSETDLESEAPTLIASPFQISELAIGSSRILRATEEKTDQSRVSQKMFYVAQECVRETRRIPTIKFWRYGS